MFENDRNTGFFTDEGNGESLDLGSITDEDFVSGIFPLDDIFGDENEGKAVTSGQTDDSKISGAEPIENKAEDQTDEEKVSEEKPISKKEEQADAGQFAAAEIPDLFEAAIAKAEKKQAESTKDSLMEKLPVFSYASAKEEIVDPSKTFDQLRSEKAEDFPELDDATSVTWKVEYGKITKIVPAPKKTTIAGFKSQIENSKEFLNSLNKCKG